MILTGVLRGLPGELKYITTVFTPDSILQNKQNYKPLLFGKRWRYGTCTGVAWFHDTYLATVNLYGEKINTYTFDEETKTFSSVQQVQNQSNPHLNYPEQMNVLPDGTVLAICNVKKEPSTINFYPIDFPTHRINPIPLLTISACGLVHNLRFSPDGRYFLYTSFDDKESLCIYNVVRDSETIQLVHLNTYASGFTFLKTKAVNFTQDSKYIIRGYALSLGESQKRPLESLVVVHKFNSDGSIGEFVSSAKGNCALEDIALVQNDSAIIVTDQANDRLYQYPFNPITGQIGDGHSVQNTERHLSFPHGLGISQNGRYLAVTNYGNDSFSVYELS